MDCGQRGLVNNVLFMCLGNVNLGIFILMVKKDADRQQGISNTDSHQILFGKHFGNRSPETPVRFQSN